MLTLSLILCASFVLLVGAVLLAVRHVRRAHSQTRSANAADMPIAALGTAAAVRVKRSAIRTAPPVPAAPPHILPDQPEAQPAAKVARRSARSVAAQGAGQRRRRLRKIIPHGKGR